MRCVLTFDGYNHRRYSRPWIAKVTSWPIGKSPTLDFGGLNGLEAEIEATPGDILRWGQRDNRGNNSLSEWGIAQADGGIAGVTPEIARVHWLATHGPEIRTALISED